MHPLGRVRTADGEVWKETYVILITDMEFSWRHPHLPIPRPQLPTLQYPIPCYRCGMPLTAANCATTPSDQRCSLDPVVFSSDGMVPHGYWSYSNSGNLTLQDIRLLTLRESWGQIGWFRCCISKFALDGSVKIRDVLFLRGWLPAFNISNFCVQGKPEVAAADNEALQQLCFLLGFGDGRGVDFFLFLESLLPRPDN